MAFIFMAMLLLDENSLFPGWWALLPTTGTALVIQAGPRAWVNRVALASYSFVFVGLIHLALRPEKGANIKEAYRIESRPSGLAKRIGIEKHGDIFALYLSLNGEPMHQVGKTAELHFKKHFYVGIGFCSHVPDKSDTAVLSQVVLENSAGQVR